MKGFSSCFLRTTGFGDTAPAFERHGFSSMGDDGGMTTSPEMNKAAGPSAGLKLDQVLSEMRAWLESLSKRVDRLSTATEDHRRRLDDLEELRLDARLTALEEDEREPSQNWHTWRHVNSRLKKIEAAIARATPENDDFSPVIGTNAETGSPVRRKNLAPPLGGVVPEVEMISMPEAKARLRRYLEGHFSVATIHGIMGALENKKPFVE